MNQESGTDPQGGRLRLVRRPALIGVGSSFITLPLGLVGMRSSISRVATMIVVGVLVAACASSASSPPSTSPPSASSPPAGPTPPPTSLPPLVSPAIGRIAAGYQFTCALTIGGGVKCWGDNRSGQLGNGTASEVAVPGAVDVSGLASGVSAIAAGGSHACALTSSGGVKCWGDNLYGQLGDGSNADSSAPVDVVGLSRGVIAIAVGWSYTCALTAAGGVKCWGHNPFGSLGDGTMVDRSIPVDVIGLASGVTAIAAGTLHTCALMSNGGVKCWGDGQSEDASLFHRTSVPRNVVGLERRITAIAATLDRTCALTDEWAVTCWGPNYTPPPGESLPDRFALIDVSGLANGVTAVAVGEIHACVLTGSGGVACWGNNSYGQLGSVTMTDRRVPVPVEVAGLTSGVAAIAVGGQHTCALMGDGGVKCWGFNNYGQLGSVLPCSSSSVPVDAALDGDATAPPTQSEPPWAPVGRIEHATGPTDVVLRVDGSPDLGVSELESEFFNPGSFSLYGDGTVIFPSRGSEQPASEGPVIRALPFRIAHLNEDQIQSMLRFAIGEGGLGAACERYETQDTDVGSFTLISVHVVGLDKRVTVVGPNPFGPLFDYLQTFDRAASVSSQVWVPDRYWGNLFEAGWAIEIGILPDPRDAGSAAWPWPDIAPRDFVGRDEGGWIGNPRRVMSATEAAVLGLSKNGGVVARIYLVGPDGKTIYSFSMWPMLPDETTSP